MVHFLQSKKWEAFQHSLNKKVITDKGDGWSYMALFEKGKINSRLYVPYGPTITKKGALAAALQSLKEQAKLTGATFIRIEPVGDISPNELRRHGLKRVAYIQPEATSIIDLRQPRNDILNNMSSTNRNYYNNYASKGLSIKTSTNPDDISILTNLLATVASKNKIRVQNHAYLKKQAESLIAQQAGLIYYAVYDNQPIACAFVHDSETTRYYAHAASDYEHRKLNASSILISKMMLDAQDNSMTSFDLSGIWLEPGTNKSHAGITSFKRSFGGKDVTYNGTYELPVRPLQYALYHMLRLLTHTIKILSRTLRH